MYTHACAYIYIDIYICGYTHMCVYIYIYVCHTRMLVYILPLSPGDLAQRTEENSWGNTIILSVIVIMFIIIVIVIICIKLKNCLHFSDSALGSAKLLESGDMSSCRACLLFEGDLPVANPCRSPCALRVILLGLYVIGLLDIGRLVIGLLRDRNFYVVGI